MDRNMQRREQAMRRRMGASPAAVERMHREQDAKPDWRGTCQTCGARLTGSIEEILQHRHDEEASA